MVTKIIKPWIMKMMTKEQFGIEEARKRDADRMSPRQAWRAIQAGMPDAM